MSKPAKTWKFTLFDYVESDEKLIADWDKTRSAYGREICPTTGRRHLQGHITFKRAYRLTGLKKIHAKMHWEKAICHDWNYELKEKDYVIDDRRKQGSRSDILDAVETLKDKGIDTMKIEHPVEYIKYHSGFEKLNLSICKQRDTKPNVYWLHGPTGSGKTRWVWDNFDDVYTKDSSEWWDGYCQNDCILIDDYRGGLRLNYLLQVLDRYPMRVQIKGGYTQLNSPNIVITSCKSPEDTYRNCDENIDQLLRRIDEVRFVTVTVTEVVKGNTDFYDFGY